ncbi:MAG: Membrane-associated phospholipid phosphatase [Candidatus Methanocomedens sp.]|nr:MAG: Membrane-associated phospholipid phosphatase [ANME-2 cluster archaeon]
MDFYQIMLFYKDAFDPKYFLFLSFILIVFYDWKNQTKEIKYFFERIAVISISYIVALIIVDLIMMQIVGRSSSYPQYLEDYSNLAGLMLGLALSIALWKKFKFGKEFLHAAFGLLAVSIPFAVISYFWNISGHVTYTAAPVTYLVLLDRRLLLLYAIPVVMVFNRPYVGAHTPLQSISGFILGTALMFFSIKIIHERRKTGQS